MPQAAQLQFPTPDESVRLRRLGISPEAIAFVGTTMLEASQFAHPLGARTEPGVLRWSHGTGALRQSLLPFGWHSACEEGLELTLNPDRSIAIAVTSGGDNVGNKSHKPATKFRRGRKVSRQVSLNFLQISLFSAEERRASESGKYALWFLLHHFKRQQLNIELVCPRFLDDDGKQIDCAERLSFGTFGYREDDGFLGNSSDGPSDTPPSGPVITIVPR